MTMRVLRAFSRLHANNPLPEPQPPAWTRLPEAPKPTGIGHSGARVTNGVPVGAGEAPTSSPHGFAPDCSQPSTPAASERDSIK